MLSGVCEMGMRRWKTNERMVVLDLEMIELSESVAKRSHFKYEILQIGAVMLNSEFEVISRFNMILTPKFAKDYIIRLNKLSETSDHSFTSRGKIEQAFIDFCQWIGIDPVDVFVWSPNDFYNLKNELFAKLPLEYRKFCLKYLSRFIDLQKVFMDFTGASRMPSLDYALDLVHEGFIGTRHNAFDDSKNTARVLARLSNLKAWPREHLYIIDYDRSIEFLPEYQKATVAQIIGTEEYYEFTSRNRNGFFSIKPDVYGVTAGKRISMSLRTFFCPGLKGEHRFAERVFCLFHGPLKPASCKALEFEEIKISEKGTESKAKKKTPKKNEPKVPIKQEIMQLFSSDWKDERLKVIAELIALTGEDYSYISTMSKAEAACFLQEVSSGCWYCRESDSPKTISLYDYLQKSDKRDDEQLFSDSEGQLPQIGLVEDAIEAELKNLKLSKRINLALLRDYGATH